MAHVLYYVTGRGVPLASWGNLRLKLLCSPSTTDCTRTLDVGRFPTRNFSSSQCSGLHRFDLPPLFKTVDIQDRIFELVTTEEQALFARISRPTRCSCDLRLLVPAPTRPRTPSSHSRFSARNAGLRNSSSCCGGRFGATAPRPCITRTHETELAHPMHCYKSCA